MDNLQEQVVGLLQKHNRLTEDFVCYKMGVTPMKAKELCEYAWYWRAKNNFYQNHLGMSIEEYEGICNAGY